MLDLKYIVIGPGLNQAIYVLISQHDAVPIPTVRKLLFEFDLRLLLQWVSTSLEEHVSVSGAGTEPGSVSPVPRKKRATEYVPHFGPDGWFASFLDTQVATTGAPFGLRPPPFTCPLFLAGFVRAFERPSRVFSIIVDELGRRHWGWGLTGSTWWSVSSFRDGPRTVKTRCGLM